MGNLTKKTITRGAVVALALSAGAATTANAAVTRTAGADRYATANAIFKAWPTTTDTAVLAAGMGHDVDALTVAPLAKAKNAPVILVDTTATTAAIVAQFSAFKTVYIANGTGVISKDVETALTAAGKTVTRLGGATRTATALNIAKALGTVNNIVVANGDDAHLVDTLSIASIAAAKGMPIFLTSGGSLSADEATFAKGLNATNVYALGGTSVVSDDAVAGLGKATRLAGSGRYETNAAIVNAFKADLDLSNIYVASGEDANLIDALAGAPLAGLKKAPIVFAHNSLNADVNTLLKGAINDKTNIVVLGGTGAVSADAAGAIMNIQTPNSYNPGTNNGPVSVSSATAIAANQIKVVFSSAVADTSKVTIALKGTAAIDQKPTWNSAKTEVVITTSYSLPEGSYTVNVKNDTTDLGTSTVAITQQKVAKIQITSKVLSVVPAGTGLNAGEAFATYTVLDQYGNDISSQPLGNNLIWTVGIGTVDTTLTKNGILAVAPSGNVPLNYYTTASINVYDTNTYVPANATLTVSQSSGVISSLALNKITSPNNDDLNAGNTTGQWYIDYTALDASSNPTTNYTLISSGILSINGGSYFTGEIVKDPTDDKKAAISLKLNSNAGTLFADTQVPVTVVTTNGQSATINVSLKKAAEVDTFKVSAPDNSVASGETVLLPFTAFDQNNVAITDFDKLDGKVNLSISNGTIGFIRNSDGSASVQAVLPTISSTGNAQTVYINSSVIRSGKPSQLTLTVQKPVLPDSLAVDTSSGKQFLEPLATLGVDFGFDSAGLTLQDQYGRSMDITNQDLVSDGTYYFARATISASTPGILTLTPKNDLQPAGAASATVPVDIYNNNKVIINAVAPGTASVNYVIYKVVITGGVAAAAVPTTITKSVQYTVVKEDDIKDYSLDTVAKAIKITGNANIGNDEANDFAADPTVWGKTAGGALVRLNPNKVVSAAVDSSNFTLSKTDLTVTTAAGASLDYHVYAKDLADKASTGSSTTLTVTVQDSSNNYRTVTTPIKSTTDSSVPTSVSFSALDNTGTKGITLKGNTVTIDTHNVNYAATLASLQKRVTAFDANGNNPANSKASINFSANDQFNGDAAFSMVSVSSQSFAATVNKPVASINPATNVLTITNTASIAAGDYYVLTAITANGKIQTVKVTFK